MRNFLDKYYLYIKVFIIVFCMLSFAMMFTTQIVVTSDLGVETLEFTSVYFNGYFNWAVVGYSLILVSVILFIASFFLSHKHKLSFYLDIISALFLLIGIILVSCVALFYRSSYIASVCIIEECIDLYMTYTYRPDVGVYIAIVFSIISFIETVLLLPYRYKDINIDEDYFDIDDLPDELDE